MAQAAAAQIKINTKVKQLAPGPGSSWRPSGPRMADRPPKGPRVSGDARESVRDAGRPVIEMESGILVYPPEADGESWRATFTENGHRRFRLIGVPGGRRLALMHVMPVSASSRSA